MLPIYTLCVNWKIINILIAKKEGTWVHVFVYTFQYKVDKNNIMHTIL